MKHRIIGLCGPAGSGKDSIAEHLVAKHRYVKMANADLLKRMAKQAFDFTDEQLWGPSAMRNASDKRYMRKHGPWTLDSKCTCCGMPGELNGLEEGGPCHLTPRFALQTLGTEWGRMCFENIWIQQLLGAAQTVLDNSCDYNAKEGLCLNVVPQRVGFSSPYAGVVISDVRFQNEIDAIKQIGGKVVRIVRGTPALVSIGDAAGSPMEMTTLSGATAQHKSETELHGVPKESFDYLFENNGDLGTLARNADRMMDVLKGRIMAFDSEQADVPPFLRKKRD